MVWWGVEVSRWRLFVNSRHEIISSSFVFLSSPWWKSRGRPAEVAIMNWRRDEGVMIMMMMMMNGWRRDGGGNGSGTWKTQMGECEGFSKMSGSETTDEWEGMWESLIKIRLIQPNHPPITTKVTFSHPPQSLINHQPKSSTQQSPASHSTLRGTCGLPRAEQIQALVAVEAMSGEQIRGRYVILRSDDQVQTNSKKSKKRKERVGGGGV